jgi:uncharacterized repeat protein (TIGR02543 family)
MSNQTKYHDININLSSNEFTAPASNVVTQTITLKKNDGTNSTVDTKSTTHTTPYSFNKWNTKADGTGTNYDAGGIYSSNASATMYAQWKTDTTIKSKIKLGTSSRSSASNSIVLTAKLSDDIELKYPLTQTISYDFSAWNTDASGTGTSYNATTEYAFDNSATLYAIYAPNTSTPPVTLPSNVFREGYTFKGWSKTQNGALIDGTSYTPSGTETIYAVWEGEDGIQKGMYIYSDTDKQWHKVVNSKVN